MDVEIRIPEFKIVAEPGKPVAIEGSFVVCSGDRVIATRSFGGEYGEKVTFTPIALADAFELHQSVLAAVTDALLTNPKL